MLKAFNCPDVAEKYLTDVIVHRVRAFIPTIVSTVPNSTHPWVTDDCKQAIVRKHALQGQPGYDCATAGATDVLRAAC